MTREQYANNPTSTLNGAINNSVTTLVVSSAASFPTTGNFRIIIDSEIMKVTAVSGTTFTISRGQEGTTAASHSNLANVFGILTVASWDAMREDNEFLGTYSTRPSAELKGRIARYTDALVVERDNGGSWDSYGPIWNLVPPDLSQFSWVNQDGGSVVQQGAAIYLSGPVSGADSVRCQVKSVPGSTPYSVEFAFTTNFQALPTNHFGFVLRESGSGKLVTFSIQFNSLWILGIYKFNSVVSFNSQYLGIQPHIRDVYWMKFRDDGATRNFYISGDGVNWALVNSHGNTNFLTADQWGFYIDPTGIPYAMGITVIHWKEGS